MAIRDTRHIRFEGSLLGTIQTSLSSGPIHFDYFPNFTVSLHDPHIRKALTLNIKTLRTLMVPGTKQLALIYRVYYKCIRTNLMFKPLTRKQKEKPPLSRPQPLDLRFKYPRPLSGQRSCSHKIGLCKMKIILFRSNTLPKPQIQTLSNS